MSEKKEKIKKRLTAVFRDVFDDEALEIFEDTTANDIESWDSLRHIILVIAVEKEFKLQLKAAEIGKLENVGKMLDLLEERT